MKVLSKLLLGLFVGFFGFISFSNASQFFAYTKHMAKKTNIPNFVISGTTFYTDIVDIDKSNFTGKVKFLVQSSYNCSPGTIYIKDNSANSSSYLRYSMNYISDGALCVSPEINLNGLSSLKFFYGTTQNTSNANYVQFIIVDSDSFNNSVKALSTGFNATVSVPTDCPVCPTSSINVLYNNENSSTTINCNGDNVIQIDGLSTITATNKFTPYFNIDYKDEDNQALVESYSKDILYLSGGLFKKTYTGNNEWILNNQSTNGSSDCSSDSSFSGYLPSFNITGGIQDVTDSGNIFNNFAENGLTVLLSNIPNYIQYIIMIILLFFILGFIRKFKRR